MTWLKRRLFDGYGLTGFGLIVSGLAVFALFMGVFIGGVRAVIYHFDGAKCDKLETVLDRPTHMADYHYVSPGPRVELFARAPRLGWDHWGHGYEVAS